MLDKLTMWVHTPWFIPAVLIPGTIATLALGYAAYRGRLGATQLTDFLVTLVITALSGAFMYEIGYSTGEVGTEAIHLFPAYLPVALGFAAYRRKQDLANLSILDLMPSVTQTLGLTFFSLLGADIACSFYASDKMDLMFVGGAGLEDGLRNVPWYSAAAVTMCHISVLASRVIARLPGVTRSRLGNTPVLR